MVVKYVVSPHGRRGTYPNITSAVRAWSTLHAASRRPRAALIEIVTGHYEEIQTLTVRGEVRLVAVDGPGSVVVNRLRGTVLETYGSVAVEGLVLTSRDADHDVLACAQGTLTLDRVEVRTPGGVGTHARPNTQVTLRDSVFLHGRTLFTASGGTIERCRFTDAADNAIAAIEGARLSVRGCRIEGSRIHGVRASDAHVQVADCELTGTGNAALAADTRAELAVTDCVITAVHAEGVMFIEQSRGSVDRTRVTDARHGVGVASGADPVVRDCVFTACRDTGITVRASARGRFEGCRIVDARNIAVFSTEGGAPEVIDCRVSGGNVGIAVTEGGRGRFTRVGIEDLPSSALRVWNGGGGVFEHVRVDRCTLGLDTTGDGGTTADLTDVVFHDVETAVTALGQSRVKLKDVSLERGAVGFFAGEDAHVLAHDCAVTTVSIGGAIASGKGKLFARNLTVTGSEGSGLGANESGYLDVANSEFTDCAMGGALFADEAGGRLVHCTVNGTQGPAVRHDGRVDIVGLRSSLPVVRETVRTVDQPQQTIINHYDGTVFIGPVNNSQIAWDNQQVIQRQTNEDGADT
ncbi:right-handed parallel beta-helix repeat-containing protein [Streptomyces sp. P9(2023)]|uniref:right-handed parallel beta-helix repeat-containing protein n=1 Tax=Streptomyces sp. P9(2023) TaxID=3064394 RepID=UPI0028F44601|nr:right-handed parallel beta-helix repeat-containing protein [Streptomyces sp. P9(2023)]MDT9690753.1 right-handed parallel beta-helix repeat-containing protein [Streptomyces sp. P9(2023)]